jgi:hypothetical protein
MARAHQLLRRVKVAAQDGQKIHFGVGFLLQ